ncbi:MAG: M48 family metallopeptidase [Clostridia bacterium]|nr:M48 family metallopeptidase [Clostridia bacterium]
MSKEHIDGIDFEIKRRRGRKKLSIFIDRDGNCEVRSPWNASRERIFRFVASETEWIHRVQNAKKEKLTYRVSEEKTAELREKAKLIVPGKIEYYCRMMNIEPPVKITITSAKHRWGSCTDKRHINISLYLMLYPEEAIDYVIVHEIAHLKELNHSKKFWSIVESVFPDYKERRQMLTK